MKISKEYIINNLQTFDEEIYYVTSCIYFPLLSGQGSTEEESKNNFLLALDPIYENYLKTDLWDLRSIEHKYLESVVEDLISKLNSETGHLSNPNAIHENEHYQSLIGLGTEIIPIILDRVLKRGENWDYLLATLTGHSIKDNRHVKAGVIITAREAWLNWALGKGHISYKDDISLSKLTVGDLRRFLSEFPDNKSIQIYGDSLDVLGESAYTIEKSLKHKAKIFTSRP